MSIKDISNTDRINYLNMGLIVLSVGVALYIPFELFLFSYAVLGPAHYLTEISWLHERNYFAKGKRDFIFLGVAGILLFLVVYVFRPYKILDSNDSSFYSTALVYLSFAAAFGMVVFKDTFYRLIAFIIILACVLVSKTSGAVIFFSVFLPTLIHVYIFTGLFMLYGALKSKSISGYISCILFVLAPFALVLFIPHTIHITDYAKGTYKHFAEVNRWALNLWDSDVYAYPPHTQEGYNSIVNAVYDSKIGLIIMRFIAFAYTYHYLNWFSKTSVIKWHLIPKKRMAVIAVLWAVSIGFYFYDYKLGFDVLFMLSFMHVFLEFPLNHVTIIGIGKEIGVRLGFSKPAPAPAKSKRK